jgi:glutathione peroxidase
MRGILKRVYGGTSTDGGGSSIYESYGATQPGIAAYKGKVLLIVNSASQCGFVNQYDALEALWQQYQSRGLVVLGFPSNDFLGQEPKGDAEIQAACRLNHGVTFALFPKAPVKGDGQQPVFKFLTQEGPADLRGPVRWNFEKFLVDKKGFLVGRWRSYVSPKSRSLVAAIERHL